MKGKIEIFYDMPLLAEYLERTGKKLSEDDVKSAIEPMVHEAVVYHLNDCTPMITGAIREMLINQPVAPRSREVFRSIPQDSLYIFFDEDEQRSQKISREIRKRKKNLFTLMLRNGSNNKSYRLPMSPTKLKMLVDRVKVSNNVQYIEGMKSKIEKQEVPKTPCKVLFLDLDGVLNTEDYFASLKDKGLPTEDSFGNLFSPDAVENLRRIIEATGAQIVISSSWRFAGLGTLKLMWKERHLPGNLYDITSLFVADDYIRAHMDDQSFDFYEAMTSAREMEISAWLQEHPEVTNYVILDDLDSFRQHEAHLVKINPKTGITPADAEQVITILNTK